MAILDLFEDRVRENPYDIYIQSDNISYTFKKVDNSSNYIATVVDNSSFEIIPIYIKNDILVIPTILGILKSGKIPLPISTDLEFKIAKEQIKDIKYDVLLTDVSDISETILISKNIFDEDWYFSRKQQNNKGCYIVSTSGTTGVPKKVLINEDSLIAVLQTYKNITNFGKDSSFVNTSPYTFDASLFGFFLPIIGGGRSVLFGELGSSSISKVSHTAYLIAKRCAGT
ncbi:AMP-binding protein [Streptococcus pneumoniae]|uniref:AMP-binding protein n=1 Tax=Streptococcus pneumoniae TaxID=1313 RepID=UPI0010D0B0B0|nr:AMP-binding protein [Streptococcus pneumoniae]MBW5122537.1 AMP-binding protein [Streptococcus pneumoniae]MBW5194946.1 AMP-binding protein [Streptococcus pneumoniae]MDG7290839.1 AMP-binding protein [Streptococcus pneumoniae]MDG7351674.1 AMP-binding protein [Streptococcus pneumoniae]MDG7356407.1 AMP-binding protein [Streptococcus pneumoniae]